MKQFASSAMMRALAQGMRDLGLHPPEPLPRSAAASATVDLDLKRALVKSAVEQGGLACLPLLGRGLHRHTHDPTHRTLASARDPADLFRRWTQLERYVHSHHRLKVIGCTADSATTQHVARNRGAAPSAAEDLVVLGVLAALLEAIGATDVEARVGEQQAYPLADAIGLAPAARRSETGLWTWQWKFDVDHRHRTREVTLLDAGPPINQLVAAQPWPDIAKKAFVLIASHLTTPLRVDAVAHNLHTSPRSLQRVLQREGLTCEGLLAEARCRSAAWWLLQTEASIAEIGFLAGYADQSHFTRDYKARSGLTPGLYRSEFAASSAGINRR